MRLRTAALVTAAVAALTLLAVPAAAHAYGHPGHGRGGDPAERVLHMAKALGLSDAQAAQVQAIVAKHKDGAGGDARQSMRDAREALAKTIHDPAATDDQVRDAAAAVAAIQTQLAVRRHRLAVEISSVLTDDQKAKLAEMIASFKDHRPGPHSEGPHGF